jgi:hypothetical protein
MRHIRSHLTYANVMATFAVFLVLGGGTAVALNGSNTVFSDDIVNDQVYSADVRNDTLSGGGLAAPDLKDVTRSIEISAAELNPAFAYNVPTTAGLIGGAPGLHFDTGASSDVVTTIEVPPSYVPGTDLTVRLAWGPLTGSGGNVVWQVGAIAIAAGGSLAQPSNYTEVTTASPTTAGVLARSHAIVDATSASLDPGDLLILDVSRPNEAPDTAPDIRLAQIEIRYQAQR